MIKRSPEKQAVLAGIDNDGAHQPALARWALRVDFPRKARANAGKVYFDDDRQTPEAMNVTSGYGREALILGNSHLESLRAERQAQWCLRLRERGLAPHRAPWLPTGVQATR